MRLLALGLAAMLIASCGAKGEPASANHPEGPVVDFADIIPAAEEEDLDRKLRSYFDRTGNALIVTSIVSLDARPIEDVSLDTARGWGIGDAKSQRGLMIIVAPNEREVRIEVACGLESVITDARAKHIIERTMVPLFRTGKIDKATIAGAEALIRATTEFRGDLGKSPHSPGCAKEAA